MKFSDEEIMFLIQATQGAVIKGKDAILVASLLQRLMKNYENRAQENLIEK